MKTIKQNEICIVISDSSGKIVSEQIFINNNNDNQNGLQKTTQTGTHYYMTPALRPDPLTAGKGCIGISAAHDGTDVWGAGSYWGKVYYNQSMYVGIGKFNPGTTIQTSNEVQAVVWEEEIDWARAFTLLPERQWGTRYFVPRLAQDQKSPTVYTSVVTRTNATVLRAAGEVYFLNSGDAVVLQLNAGVEITANNKVFVTTWENFKRWSRGVTLDAVD